MTYVRNISRILVVGIILVLVAWLYQFANEYRYSKQAAEEVPVQSTYDIVAFGDSLVEGLGTPDLGGFVSVLEDRFDIDIFNAGTRSDTTVDLLERVHEDVLMWDPLIVILIVGGNDVLHGVLQDTVLENLDTLFSLFQEKDITVIYGEPSFSETIWSDYAKKVKQVAEKYDNVIYVEDLLQGFFFDPRKKFDVLHPNDSGYEIMADRLELPLCQALGICARTE